MIREPIYAAVFELACAAPGLVTMSRKLLHWNDVKPNKRPALFQAQKTETAVRTTGQPCKWLLDIDLYIYVSTAGVTHPGEVLNPIVDAIDAAFGDPFPGVSQTLGGLVEWARIDGTIETDEGTLGADTVAIIPVRILAL